MRTKACNESSSEFLTYSVQNADSMVLTNDLGVRIGAAMARLDIPWRFEIAALRHCVVHSLTVSSIRFK